jgi:ATP-dependent RNA helicase DDX3X
MNMIMSGGDVNEDADHIYMMFSATFPKEFRRIARQYMEEDYVRLRAGRYSSTHQNIKQVIKWVEESNKRACLYDLIFGMPPARTVIFVNVKQKADDLDDFLYNKGLASTALHGDRTQREREDAM